MHYFDAGEMIKLINRTFIEPRRSQRLEEATLRIAEIHKNLGVYRQGSRPLADLLESEDFQLQCGIRLLEREGERGMLNSAYRYKLVYTLQDA